MMDFIYPILAILLVFSTRNSRYQTINCILAVLLLAHYGWEIYILGSKTYDSIWHDIYMLGIYTIAATAFWLLKGFAQFALALVGVLLSIIYGTGWFFVAYPHDYGYKDAMTLLTILQLLAASRGALWTILNRMIAGGKYGRRMVRDSHHGVERRSSHHGHS